KSKTRRPSVGANVVSTAPCVGETSLSPDNGISGRSGADYLHRNTSVADSTTKQRNRGAGSIDVGGKRQTNQRRTRKASGSTQRNTTGPSGGTETRETDRNAIFVGG